MASKSNLPSSLHFANHQDHACHYICINTISNFGKPLDNGCSYEKICIERNVDYRI